MDKQRRKELRLQYKQVRTYMGVIQIRNIKNGKIYLGAYPNLKNKWFTIKAQLEMERFVNAELQGDWNRYGEESFVYEVLEQKSTEDIGDVDWALHQMERRWHERRKPYGDAGYNRPLK